MKTGICVGDRNVRIHLGCKEGLNFKGLRKKLNIDVALAKNLEHLLKFVILQTTNQKCKIFLALPIHFIYNLLKSDPEKLPDRLSTLRGFIN